MQAKRAAGRHAADLVASGARLGLGTGSTVYFALERLAERVREEGLDLVGVPTSVQTEKEAERLGLRLTTLDREPRLDLTIDGADEVDSERRLIKGGGGALLREKVVAAASEELVVIVELSKVVDRLGTTFRLPVEVVPFACTPVSGRLKDLGCEPQVRGADGEPSVTDNGNWILDCTFPEGIADPLGLEVELDRIPGVVECGLFIGLAGRIVIGHDDGSVEVR
ncbi:MAG: ribose 5-phosphate isomerase A [Planctomycetes bacterium]|nr:ribose 5-phosphate isomerase A [Planctomycetota bacterium]MDP6424938.1 ribose 5-phosphate isomerase A [Planctomycetota bacterium]